MLVYKIIGQFVQIMNSIVLPKNHYFPTTSHQINELSLLLFRKYQINMFVYGKYYEDGKCILLCNNEDWMRYHLAQGYVVPAPVPFYLLKRKEAFNLIQNDNDRFQQAKYDLMQKYNSDQAVDFIIKGKNYYEVICFAFPVGYKDAINTIINNLNELKQLATVFKDKAFRLLLNAEKHKITLPANMSGIDFSKTTVTTCSYTEEIKHIRDYFKVIFNTNFTERQFSVLHQTVKGKTANQIATDEKLSCRTIEHYLDEIKNKLRVSSKSELIQKTIGCFRDLI